MDQFAVRGVRADVCHCVRSFHLITYWIMVLLTRCCSAESFTALLLDYVGVFRQVRVSSKDRRSARAVVSQLRSPEQPVQTSAG